MDSIVDIFAFLLDLLSSYWPGIIIGLGFVFIFSKFLRVLFREGLEVMVAINKATEDGKLTGDEIREIIAEGMDAKKNVTTALKQLKDDLRDKTIKSLK